MLKFLRPLVALGLAALVAPLGAGSFFSSGVQSAAKLQSLPADCQLAAKSLLSEACEETFLIEFTDDFSQQQSDLVRSGNLLASFETMNLSAYELDGQELGLLAKSPTVKRVVENTKFSVAATQTQSNAPWHLDRIDGASPVAPAGPYAYSYEDSELGAGVRIYIVDTGINTSHVEFTGRTIPGYSSVGVDTTNTLDCNGHGTHVAALAGGTTFGAAKQATIVPVRVLDCAGAGTLFGVLQGLSWIADNTFVGQPAVVNMSLGGDRNEVLDAFIENLTDQGLAFVVAAGNTGVSATNVSPAASPGAITVGASAISDSWASFSNFGPEVDITAPGVDIRSAWYSANNTTAVSSGTSMAAAIVSGVAAVQMSNGYQRPEALLAAIGADALRDVITSIPAGTPNLLLQNTSGVDTGTTNLGSEYQATVPNDPAAEAPVDVDPILDQPDNGGGGGTLPVLPPTYGKPSVSVLGNSATVSWSIPETATDITGQILKLWSGTTELQTLQLSGSVTSYTLNDLADGIVYRVSIAAVSAAGTGAFSPDSDPFEIGKVVLGPSGGEFSAWVKKINDTQVKFYAKFPQIGQKIQFMVQDRSGVYREIAWLRVTDSRIDENGEYIGLQNRIYFIRTIDLRDGKNRLRILVDGQLLDRTRTYTL